MHVGSPKTESSALHAFLLLNAQKLRKKGYHYPVNYKFNQAFQTSSGNAYKLGALIEKYRTYFLLPKKNLKSLAI